MVAYCVEVTQAARVEIKGLPGNMLRRILGVVKGLQTEPLPPKSKVLDLEKLSLEPVEGVRFCRLRVENWRVIYAIEDEVELITVLAVRKRPPYQYDDLVELIRGL